MEGSALALGEALRGALALRGGEREGCCGGVDEALAAALAVALM